MATSNIPNTEQSKADVYCAAMWAITSGPLATGGQVTELATSRPMDAREEERRRLVSTIDLLLHFVSSCIIYNACFGPDSPFVLHLKSML